MTNPADLEAFLKGIRQNDLPIYVPPGLRYRDDPAVSYRWFPTVQGAPDKVHLEIEEFLNGKRLMMVEYYPPQQVLIDESTAHREILLQEEGFSVYYLQTN